MTPLKTEGKEPVKQEKVKEEKKREEVQGGEGSGEEQKEKMEGDILGKRRSRRLEESDKDSDEDDQEEEDDDDDDSEKSRLRDRYIINQLLITKALLKQQAGIYALYNHQNSTLFLNWIWKGPCF